ncbi:uncharacterized mitochondrial protein-like protein [Tanacetum coccineum]|uniref:Uncharacterized mitochondrial protein-like protein n=1 Tax=Tanacetum coccineum TaxID=301880 RepID=A0ABQ5G461_9ASTR
MLKDVYYIPALRSNVISLGQATISGYDISIRGDFLTMRDSWGSLLIKVPRSANRLYKAQLKVGKEDTNEVGRESGTFTVLCNDIEENVTNQVVDKEANPHSSSVAVHSLVHETNLKSEEEHFGSDNTPNPGTSLDLINEFKKRMASQFEMSDLGELTYYLGIKVSQGKDCLEIKQERYAMKILKEVGMEDCNPSLCPMEPGLKLSKAEDEPEVEATQYRKMETDIRQKDEKSSQNGQKRARNRKSRKSQSQSRAENEEILNGPTRTHLMGRHAQSEEVQELLYKLLQDLQSINEELAEYINTPSWNLPTSSYDDDDDEYSFATQEYLMTCSTAITPDSPKMDSLITVDKHLDTILATESDEVIKSSVEDLVQIPSESEVTSRFELDTVEEVKDFHTEDGEIEDDILREKLLKINLLIAKIEAINSNPPLSSDFVTKSPSAFPNTNDSPSLHENESFHFDVPSSPRPPAKPPDDGIYFEPDTGLLTTKVVGDISEHYALMPRLLPTQPTLCPVIDTLLPFSSENEDKVHLLSHRGFKAFQLFSESPMMIFGGDIPILDVLIASDYEASRAHGFALRSLELQSSALLWESNIQSYRLTFIFMHT